MRVLHWFRNDLRTEDNTAIARAAPHAEQMGFVFVFDPHLLEAEAAGEARVRFLRARLEQLAKELEGRGHALWIRRGDPVAEIPKLAEQARASVVTWNRDVSPYAKRRDEQVEARLAKRDVAVRHFKDRVVFEAGEVRTRQGDAYRVYTPFRNAWWERLETEGVERCARFHWPPPIPGVAAGSLPGERALGVARDAKPLPGVSVSAAGKRLRHFLEDAVADYAEQRDRPAVDGTSRLSAYLRLGVVSVRRCFEQARAFAEETPPARAGVGKWLDELVWREFYAAILEETPHVLRGAHRPEYDALEWEAADEPFEAWCRGETGIPFVDAAMRELLATGYMHNRGRMVTASFLTKQLGVDWRRGERFFMQHLIDGDPASNNGGWQWAASTGTDAQPYFRIFNPVRQSERFDPEGVYLKRWLPELEGATGRALHEPWRAPLETPDYPAPMVDLAEARERALARYQRIRGSGH